MARKRKIHDYSQILIWSAILVTTARYAGAFVSSDVGELTGPMSEGMTILMLITGIGMGLLDVLGGAYIFDGWRRAIPRAGQRWSFRFKVLTFFVFSLFLVGLWILVPFTMSRVSQQSMIEVLGSSGFWFISWSIAVNIAPYLLIGGVVSGQSNVVGVTKTATDSESAATDHGVNGKVSGKIPPETATIKDWRYLPDEDKELIAGMTTRQVVRAYDIPERTARNWVTRAALLDGDEDQE